jgi:hypothetical protein
VYEYLDSIKILESGTGEDIAKARKEYWKRYKSEWRKLQKQRTRQITVMLTNSEVKLIEDAAKKHKRSKPALIKAMCLAHIQKRYVVPDVFILNEIRSLLSLNYNALKNLLNENAIPYQIGTDAMKHIAELEHKVLDGLMFPASLEDKVLDAIRKCPEYRETLLSLLQNA